MSLLPDDLLKAAGNSLGSELGSEPDILLAIKAMIAARPARDLRDPMDIAQTAQAVGAVGLDRLTSVRRPGLAALEFRDTAALAGWLVGRRFSLIALFLSTMTRRALFVAVTLASDPTLGILQIQSVADARQLLSLLDSAATEFVVNGLEGTELDRLVNFREIRKQQPLPADNPERQINFED